MKNDFKQLPHTADISIRVYGDTLADLFRNALIGMFQVVGPIIPSCRVENDRVVCDKLPIEREVVVSAHDIESLLVDFLSEALYLSDVHNEAYLDAQVKECSATHIEATLQGIGVEGFEEVELKAVTYHDLKVEHTAQGWQVVLVFDI